MKRQIEQDGAGWGTPRPRPFLPVPDFDQVCLSLIHAGPDPDRSGPNPCRGAWSRPAARSRALP